MDLRLSTTSRRQSTGRISQGTICGESQRKRPRTIPSIHILDDDSLLHVFFLYQPLWGDEDGIADWRYKGCWWYTLAHVCQRWRKIILGSATHLGLSLLCTYGTPVADTLANSPPLPLVVGYFRKDRKLTADDEEGIILALKQHGRVRRVRLSKAVTIMPKLYAIMDEEYPILEVLYITRAIEDASTILTFPESFQAPHLRYLSLGGFALPIGSRFLTTAVGLTTLHLNMGNPSTYFHPNTLIQWISLMPQLKTLNIYFEFHVPTRNIGRQLTHTPIIAPITLPNLHCLDFRGVSTYLEVLFHRMTAPRLEELNIEFFNQLTFSLPHVLQFINPTENPRFDSARVFFHDNFAGASVYPHGETGVKFLSIAFKSWHLDWQVSSVAQISNSLGQIFSVVEHLFVRFSVHSKSSEEHNEVDRTEWRKLLSPFSNVKTLRIESGLVKDLSRFLESEDGELPLGLLPELHKLEYYGRDDTGDVFTSFIDARRNADRPVALVRL